MLTRRRDHVFSKICGVVPQVRDFHKEFYRPENLTVIITGQVKPEDVFQALAPFEDKIVSKVTGV